MLLNLTTNKRAVERRCVIIKGDMEQNWSRVIKQLLEDVKRGCINNVDVTTVPQAEESQRVCCISLE